MKLTPADVERIARSQGGGPLCPACAPLASPGWESFPATESEAALERLGSLWLAGEDEPSLDEWRLPGVDGWSPLAPIAPHFHPVNRCEVWACRACGHPFLRYTEYGGYYEDRRIRELDPARLHMDPPPG